MCPRHSAQGAMTNGTVPAGCFVTFPATLVTAAGSNFSPFLSCSVLEGGVLEMELREAGEMMESLRMQETFECLGKTSQVQR